MIINVPDTRAFRNTPDSQGCMTVPAILWWRPQDGLRPFTQDSPAGTTDPSPPFQRWVPGSETTPSPAGAKESRCQAKGVLSSRTGLVGFLPRFPSNELLGYGLSPFGLGRIARGARTVMHPIRSPSSTAKRRLNPVAAAGSMMPCVAQRSSMGRLLMRARSRAGRPCYERRSS